MVTKGYNKIGIGAFGDSIPVEHVASQGTMQGDEGMKGHKKDRPFVANKHPHTEHSVGYESMDIVHDRRQKGAEHHPKQAGTDLY